PPPQHQQHVRAKSVTEFQAALKVRKKTTVHSGVVKMNTSITTLDIRCARCHQRMHGQPNVPHLVGVPQAHPPMPKALAKSPAPMPKSLAKGPVPFKNPLVKDPVPFKNLLPKDPLALNKPLLKAPKQPLQLGLPKKPFELTNQPLVIPQPKPLPVAISKPQPPVLSLAFPAPKPTSMFQTNVILPTLLAKPNNPLTRTRPSVGVPGQTPFVAMAPGLLLPAMFANTSGKPARYPEATPFQSSTGTTPAPGLPGDSPFDLPAGLSNQPAEKSETTEQSSSNTSVKDWLRPELPSVPPSILLLPRRVTPRTQDTVPDFSPVRWIAEHSAPVAGNRGS
ncbi:MAG TPA: hypothetical protein VKE98_04335, partial [Gemmataceae bacterium]|nr:hypothetical protein [Gemmataceae bacterium]